MEMEGRSGRGKHVVGSGGGWRGDGERERHSGEGRDFGHSRGREYAGASDCREKKKIIGQKYGVYFQDPKSRCLFLF